MYIISKAIRYLLIPLLFIPFVANSQMLNEDILKFMRVINLVESNYVDSVDRHKITEAAVVGLLKELDPHSYYINKEDLERVNETMSGTFEGIGVQFNILDDTLMVVSPINGGPSEKVGILAGDRIIEVDGESIVGIGITNEKVFKLLRGSKGSKVELGILRHGSAVETYTVIRDKIPIHSLDASYLIGNDIAYIKLNRFSETTMKEYYEAMNVLYEKGARNLILDLTNNGGGYMNMAIGLADEFLDKGNLLVYTEGGKSPKEVFNSTARGGMKKGKVVVMVDEGSASASEIVSGAIQDWDRGVLVGRRTFGKGLVQKQYPLTDGSAMRLTIARYHTPTGRVIQRPYEKNNKEYHMDLNNRYESGEMFSMDSITFPDSLKYSTLRLGRTVYGGGGVMPDMFVPVDTSSFTTFYRTIIRRGTLNQFVLTYLDENRKSIMDKYADFERFNSNFQVDDALVADLLAYAAKSEIVPKDGEMDRSEASIRIQLKALIVRNLYDQNTFFQIINKLDPIYNAAVKIITDDKAYNQILTKQ